MFTCPSNLSTANYTDPLFKQVRLLLNGSGAASVNGSANMPGIDRSLYNAVVTRIGTTATSPTTTTSVAHLSKSAIQNSIATGLTTPAMKIAANQIPALGTADFTIEMWFQITGAGTDTNAKVVFSSATGIRFLLTATDAPGFIPNTCPGNSLAITSGIGPETTAANLIGVGINRVTTGSGSWRHTALSRVAGVSYAYLDGILLGSAADTTNYPAQIYTVFNGTAAGTISSRNMSGYIDDLRITVGTGRYSGSTLILPTRQFPTY